MSVAAATNGGVSEDVFHLLYESSEEEEESDDHSHSFPSNSTQRKPLLKNGTTNKNKGPALPNHPVISHDEKFNDAITLASKNGLVQVSKGAIPLSKVRSRSSGKVTESGFLESSSTQGVSKSSSGANVTSQFDKYFTLDEEEDSCFVYKKLERSDTIQGISLQYHTTIAEIKRINSLITDQDFFALKYIKVPTTKHSVLLETHPVVLPSPTFSQDGAITSDDQQHATNAITSIGGGSLTATKFTSSKTDVDAKLDPVKWMETKTISINEAMSISADLLQSDLSNACHQAFSRASSVEVIQRSRSNKNIVNGADCGMSWHHAVFLMLFICVAIPLLYLLYSYITNHHQS